MFSFIFYISFTIFEGIFESKGLKISLKSKKYANFVEYYQ